MEAEAAALPAAREICAVTFALQTSSANVWEGIFVHAYKFKKNGSFRSANGF